MAWVDPSLLEAGHCSNKTIWGFSNDNHPEQTLIHMFLEYLQLKTSSYRYPSFQADFTYWGHLATDCWSKALWQFIMFAHPAASAKGLCSNNPKTRQQFPDELGSCSPINANQSCHSQPFPCYSLGLFPVRKKLVYSVIT